MSLLTTSFLMPQAAGLSFDKLTMRPAVEGRGAKHEGKRSRLPYSHSIVPGGFEVTS